MLKENNAYPPADSVALASVHPDGADDALTGPAMHALISGTKAYYLIIDADTVIRLVSPALAELWNISAVECKGLRIADSSLFNGADTGFYTALEQAVCTKPSQSTCKHNVAGSNGVEDRCYEVTFTPWADVNINMAGAVLRLVDCSELEQLRSELNETRKRFKDFAAATSDWQWEMDQDLRFVWLSREIADFTGVRREDLYGKHRKPVLETAEDEEAWNDHLKVLEGREPFRDFVFRLNSHTGIRSVRVSGVPLFDSKNNFTGYRGIGSDTTEVESVKFKARQAESRLLGAIDEFPGSLALYDADAKLIVYNRSYASTHRVLGQRLKPGLDYSECLLALLEAALIVQHNGESIVDHESWIDQQFQKLRYSGEPVELCFAGGRWVKLALQQLPDGGFLELITDTSDDKKIEMAVKEERNLLRSLIDNIPDYIYAKDAEGKFIVKNRSVSRYMNAVRESVLGMSDDPGDLATDFDYYTPEVADAYRAEEVQVIRDGRSILNQEERVSPADEKESIWLSTSKVPLLDTEGEIVGLVGTTRNITEEKLAQIELLESKERFRDFAEAAADLFWETDANFNITFVSERYYELTGYPPESVLGRAARRMILPRVNDSASIKRINNLLADRQVFSDLEIAIVKEQADMRHIVLSGKPRYSESGAFLGYRGAGRDITESRELEEILQYKAAHDDLTKLPNRSEFMRRLESELSFSQSGSETSVLGYIDLDQFKIVNDSVGHIAGDALLVQAAGLIESQLRACDTVARLGGDEFGVLVHEASLDEALSIIQRMIEQFKTFRFQWDDQVFGIGISVGLVMLGDSTADASELMSCADVACFAAKDAGRGTVHVYRQGVSDRSLQHKQLLMAAGIRNSINTDRFKLYAQPIASVAKDNTKPNHVHHYEILLRLSDDSNDLIMPGTFIPAAERYGLMGEIDRWVITQTCQQIKDNAHSSHSAILTINLSGQSLSDKTLVHFVKSQLQEYSVDPAGICFEITETAAIRNLSIAKTFIAQMKEMGCIFALDDFGNGLSSLWYLKHFDVDYLKIDGCFIRDIMNDSTDRIMVASINRIARSLGLVTIAEYVEDQGTAHVLQEIGVDMLQGYFIGKPEPFANIFTAAAKYSEN